MRERGIVLLILYLQIKAIYAFMHTCIIMKVEVKEDQSGEKAEHRSIFRLVGDLRISSHLYRHETCTGVMHRCNLHRIPIESHHDAGPILIQ